jgi:hypothetical protein
MFCVYLLNISREVYPFSVAHILAYSEKKHIYKEVSYLFCLKFVEYK